MNKQVKKALVPVLRFPEFVDAGEWEQDKLTNLITTVTPPKKLPSALYETEGEFPIIDQSKSYICGWTNDQDALISNDLPLIVFGDHTCSLKLVHESFAQGADGIKILKTKELTETTFLYQYLQFKPVVMEEYKRHFSILKEKIVAFPRKESGEQQKIADCLSSLDALITAHTQKHDALKAHKKGLMQQLFPAEGETVPTLRFPEFRDAGEWESEVFDELINVIDGDRGTNYPKSDEFSNHGYCVFLNAKNVTKNGFMFDVIQFITQEKDKLLSKGKLKRLDVILTTRGSVGHFSFYSKEVPYDNIRINSGMVVLRVKSDAITPDYLYAFSKSEIVSRTIEDISFGNAQQQLTVSEIKKFKVCYPKSPEQKKIVSCLSSVDELITAQAQKIQSLKIHKKGLMQQLFPAIDDDSTNAKAEADA
jgi:type I restriction enzyme S subunit